MENGAHEKDSDDLADDAFILNDRGDEDMTSDGSSDDVVEPMDTLLNRTGDSAISDRMRLSTRSTNISRAESTQYSIEEKVDPDDHFRADGILVLEIDKFSEFARGSTEHQQRLSKPIYVRGLPWRILAIPRDCQTRGSQQRGHPLPKCLGFFLQCNGESDMLAWNCMAKANLKVINQLGGEDYSRSITHTFYPKENDWGYSQFLNCDVLINPDSGYIKDDMVRLEVEVSADAPHGVQWDSKKHAGFIGLKNQGATCYMNSLLQAFFFTNQLRKAVYEMPTEEDEAESSVALAMQRVFFDLQYSDKPVGTKKLTKSFGWDSLDSFLQHDVQELCRVLLDNLESKMKNTKVEKTIPNLFSGKMKSFIRCLNVDYESSHVDDFYDVQLNVKGNNDVLQSFRDYVASERLDGENKYDAGSHGLQPAEKGVKFLKFPPVLHLQLMRFQYDPTIDANVKINDRFEFPERLNLNEFVDGRPENEDYTYVLHAVLVHSGDFHGGHYVVFINTKLTQQHSCWCKFDDDVVSRSSFKDAVTANYGGDDPEGPGRTFTNAYMLVYIRQSCLNTVLCSITDDDIPRHLRERLEKERVEEQNRKREKLEAHLFTEVTFIRDDIFRSHHGYDLFDMNIIETLGRERIRKKMTMLELYKFVETRLCTNYSGQGLTFLFRLWLFGDPASRDDMALFNLSRLRPCQLISSDPTMTLDEMLESDFNLIYVEMPSFKDSVMRPLMEYNDSYFILTFIKLYLPAQQTLQFVGHIMIKYREPLLKYTSQICELADLPSTAKLTVYEEVAPNKIRKIHNLCSPYNYDQGGSEITDGTILLIQNEDDCDISHNIEAHTAQMYSTIDVEISPNTESMHFIFHTLPKVEPFYGKINLNWGMYELCQYIGREINFDSERILLWKMSTFNDKPTSFLQDYQYKQFKVQDLLSLNGTNVHDPRRQKRYRVVYTRMPVPVADMDNRRQLKLQMMDEKLNIMEVTLFPPRAGTVAEILEEARREFPFAEDGSGVLRLVYVGTTPASTRVYSVFDQQVKVQEVHQKIVSPTMYTARVEEVPKDQLRIGMNEYLMPVAHFDREPTRMFGTPFFFKIADKEPFVDVLERLRKTLDVSEKEYEKYKFALIVQNKIIRYIDTKEEGRCVNLHEMRASVQVQTINSLTSMPLLGIDHLNKSRGARTGHAAEKPIIIHN